MITTSCILGILGLLALWKTCRRAVPREAAIIRQLPNGNWCVDFPDGYTAGEFPTAEDARRCAQWNGYEPVGGEEEKENHA